MKVLGKYTLLIVVCGILIGFIYQTFSKPDCGPLNDKYMTSFTTFGTSPNFHLLSVSLIIRNVNQNGHKRGYIEKIHRLID